MIVARGARRDRPGPGAADRAARRRDRRRRTTSGPRWSARHAAAGSTPAQFLEIADTLDAAARLQTSLADDRRPLLHALGPRAPRRCRRSARRSPARFDPAGELLDTASPRLGGLRAAVRVAYDRLRRRLDALVGSELGGALQEPIITLRNGRYVVPVKAEARSRVKGIVHDASGSGQTLFVEPLVAVELGNAWREAQAAEQEEVERILDELSALVAANAEPLRETLDALARFDFWAAKAQLAAEMDGVRAETADRPEVILLSARHPGLTGRVIPIDIRLGEGYTALVVTGPNTGGKTVTLRTLGLLALMHQAGLHVPAAAGLAAAGPPRRLRRHRRRAVDRPVALDVLRPPALDHPDRRGGRARGRCPARRARRRHRPDRGLGARPGAARPLHPDRRARRGDDALRGAQGLRPHDRRRPQRLGRVRPRDARRRPTGSRSGCRAAARRSRSPSGSASMPAIVADARSRLSENERAFEETLARIRTTEGETSEALDRARAAELRAAEALREAAEERRRARRERDELVRAARVRGGAPRGGPPRRRQGDPQDARARDRHRAGARCGGRPGRGAARAPARVARDEPEPAAVATAARASGSVGDRARSRTGAGRAGSRRSRGAASGRRSRPAGCGSRSRSTISSRSVGGVASDGRRRVAVAPRSDERRHQRRRAVAWSGPGAWRRRWTCAARASTRRWRRSAATSTTRRWPASTRS